MDYLCAKFGDFSFNRFWFHRADRRTDGQNHRQITDADDRYTDTQLTRPFNRWRE